MPLTKIALSQPNAPNRMPRWVKVVGWIIFAPWIIVGITMCGVCIIGI